MEEGGAEGEEVLGVLTASASQLSTDGLRAREPRTNVLKIEGEKGKSGGLTVSLHTQSCNHKHTPRSLSAPANNKASPYSSAATNVPNP